MSATKARCPISCRCSRRRASTSSTPASTATRPTAPARWSRRRGAGGGAAAAHGRGPTASARPFVFVNGFGRPVALQRFALAHEFAHLALGHGEAYDERIDWSGRSRRETDANAFAEEFVAPLAAVRRWFEMDGEAAGPAASRGLAATPSGAARSDSTAAALDAVIRLANHFGVSFWVARYRAKAAGILSSPTQLRNVDQMLRARDAQWIPRQLFLGGLRDTLSVLTAESRPGQSRNPWRIAPNGVRVPDACAPRSWRCSRPASCRSSRQPPGCASTRPACARSSSSSGWSKPTGLLRSFLLRAPAADLAALADLELDGMLGKGSPDLESPAQRFDVAGQGSAARRPRPARSETRSLGDLKAFSHDRLGQVELAAQLRKHGDLVVLDAHDARVGVDLAAQVVETLSLGAVFTLGHRSVLHRRRPAGVVDLPHIVSISSKFYKVKTYVPNVYRREPRL